MVPFALRMSVSCMLPVSHLNTFQELRRMTKTPWLHTRCSPARSAFHKKWCNKNDILAVNIPQSHKHTHTIWMRPFCSVNSAGWSRVAPMKGWGSFKPILDFKRSILESVASWGGGCGLGLDRQSMKTEQTDSCSLFQTLWSTNISLWCADGVHTQTDTQVTSVHYVEADFHMWATLISHFIREKDQSLINTRG